MQGTWAAWRRTRWLACTIALAGCETTIAGNLPELQANEMIVALQHEGIGAEKEEDEGPRGDRAWKVTVPSDDTARALKVLRARNLPRATAPGLHEVFGEGSLVPTPTEERGRYAAALAGELSRSIESIEGVLGARVHVALPDAKDFVLDDRPRAPRASVLVRHRDGDVPFDRSAVQALVAGAVDGLDPERVSVVLVPARPHTQKTEPLAKVGPIWVAHGSADLLRTIFAAMAISGMLVAAALGTLAHRHRKLARTEAPPPPTPAE